MKTILIIQHTLQSSLPQQESKTMRKSAYADKKANNFWWCRKTQKVSITYPGRALCKQLSLF